MTNTDFDQTVQYLLLDTCELAYRIIGQGEPLVFIIGWIFNSFTSWKTAIS